MKYVIYNQGVEKYLATSPVMSWVDTADRALKFNNQKKGANYLKSFKNTELSKSTDGTSVLVQYDEDNGSANFGTVENPDEILASLQNLINQMTNASNTVQVLLNSYYAELSQCDRMQEDMLHKIEFSPAVGITAVRLCKQLKEIRVRRRKIKDNIDYLRNVQNANFVDVKDVVDKLKEQQENRTYVPRELTELFN